MLIYIVRWGRWKLPCVCVCVSVQGILYSCTPFLDKRIAHYLCALALRNRLRAKEHSIQYTAIAKSGELQKKKKTKK